MERVVYSINTAVNSTVVLVENKGRAIRNMFDKVEMIFSRGKLRTVLNHNLIAILLLTDMKLHHVAEKLVPIIAAIILLLSRADQVTKHMQSMRLTSVVSFWETGDKK